MIGIAETWTVTGTPFYVAMSRSRARGFAHTQPRSQQLAASRCGHFRVLRRSSMRDMEKSRAYSAKRYAEHREAILAVHAKYHAEHADAIKERKARYYIAHRDERIAIARKWQAAHPDMRRASTKRWQAAHPGYILEHSKKWNAAHPKERAIVRSRCRAARAKCSVNDLTVTQWQERVAEYGGLCGYCRQPMGEVTQDHMTPLTRGGNHTLSNVVPACQSCNSRKYTKTLLEFVRCGMYL
jgi:5-methylcytosine-specific restriction endonuclease McrA